MAKPAICTIDGCDKPYWGRGWCKMHHMRWLRNGDPAIKTRRMWDKPAIDFLNMAFGFTGQDCLEWPFNKNRGYGRVHYRNAVRYVNRVVCEEVHGQPADERLQAAHNCGNRGCVNPNHIRWATRVENMADMVRHGTAQRGERHARAKLTESLVREIRSSSERSKDIAHRLGVKPCTISQIRLKITWKSVG